MVRGVPERNLSESVSDTYLECVFHLYVAFFDYDVAHNSRVYVLQILYPSDKNCYKPNFGRHIEPNYVKYFYYLIINVTIIDDCEYYIMHFSGNFSVSLSWHVGAHGR